MVFSIFKRSDVRYDALPNSEKEIATDSHQAHAKRSGFPFPRTILAIVAILFFVSVTSTALLVGSTSSNGSCTDPVIRREWRTLRKSERLEYLRAAKCLTQTKSRRDSRLTVHDDLTLLHSRYGSYSHDAAPFFPWHRYFIQAYENALKKHCQFDGVLPYWDWTKDYRDFFKSPIWNLEDGFGSNGDPHKSSHDRIGNCVASGPFADWNPVHFNGSYEPHCLSRQFMDETVARRVGNMTMRPSVLEAAVLDMSDYYEFLLHVEDVSHLTIPYLVQGDFRVPTAPNDPVFFLHHGQIDRIWWSWQRVSRERYMQYNGKSRDTSNVQGSLEDVLEFDRSILDAKPTVANVMDTTSGDLCYTYDVAVVE